MEILRAVGALPTWDDKEFGGLLDLLRDALPDMQFEWDLGAGEEWARVLSAQDVDALIRAPTSVSRSHRFAFVRSDSTASDVVLAVLRAHDAEVVEIADFEEPSLSIQADALATFVGPSLPPTHAFDPERFSANDLWFVSV